MTATALDARRIRARVPILRGLTWVTWRQHRLALAGVVLVLGGLALYLLINGLAMRHTYTRLGLDSCGSLDGAGCRAQLSIFQQDYARSADQLPHYLTFLPGLIGVFVGAPLLAREFETGTFRFAWTQGRSRIQWTVTKLVLLAVVLTALTLAFSAVFTWWYTPFDAVSGRMFPNGSYEVSGPVFTARTLFGFTLGALIGVLIRRTVPAMAATAAVWAAVVWASLTYLRPLIRQPITISGAQAKGAFSGSGGVPVNAAVANQWLQDAAGHHLSFDQVFGQASHAIGPLSPEQFNAYLTQHHYSQWLSYRPNTWFWHFQTIEASGYALLAVLLAIATVLLLRRRAA
jgi:ABC-type transport system involved in multi-copper enzyme maturation permease subunit